MIVCLDSGNSRIKWGVHDGVRWLAQGAVHHADVPELAGLADRYPRPERVMLANVAGPKAVQGIRSALPAWMPALREVHSGECCAGVTNLYKIPRQLGVDRWCALIGARSLTQTATLVVMAGTATTVDALTSDGRFLGGLILPGRQLMGDALGKGTAGLPVARGSYADWPTCTDDAIETGILDAQAGAIERAWRRLEGNVKICLISGGNAERIARCLAIPHRVAENLPLEGLKQLAHEDCAG